MICYLKVTCIIENFNRIFVQAFSLVIYPHTFLLSGDFINRIYSTSSDKYNGKYFIKKFIKRKSYRNILIFLRQIFKLWIWLDRVIFIAFIKCRSNSWNILWKWTLSKIISRRLRYIYVGHDPPYEITIKLKKNWFCWCKCGWKT